jgi:2-polyprenyl-3-methyl-5-hydroxy-6-metoxy-1,4-benzoquinol methylase
LRALERINLLSASAGTLWRPIRELAMRIGKPLKVLDVACGAGDVAIRLWERARRDGIDVKVAGCDISPRAVEHARQRAAARQADVQFFPLDVLRESLPEEYDVLTCSLFLHHLETADCMELLRTMCRAARRLVLASDLRRSRLGWWLAWSVTRLTGSWVARIDGPLSVQAAFTPAELRDLAAAAGLSRTVIARRWPCRMLLLWEKQETGVSE